MKIIKKDLTLKLSNTQSRENNYENEIDPDNNFYKKNQENDCQYYTVNKLNVTVNNEGFIMIHFNRRSLPHDYDKIIDCLKDIKVKFDFIALTETWLNKK